VISRSKHAIQAAERNRRGSSFELSTPKAIPSIEEYASATQGNLKSYIV
jgi:hypothetical protein